MGEDIGQVSQDEEIISDAEQVYLLLNDKYRISRNLRVQWYLKTLNKILDFRTKMPPDDENEIALLSAYTSKVASLSSQKFRITSETRFFFLSRKYCFTFVLDLSPSIAKVDIQHETVLTDEIPTALIHCLRALVQSFIIPGSDQVFQPELYISILTYQPFYAYDSNNFIVHGFKLTLNNLDKLMSFVKKSLEKFLNDLRGNILAMGEFRSTPVSADISLLNIIRFGLLTLNLLPDNSYEGIVIITDGNLNFPDSNTMESVLLQLRMTMVSLSFIQIGSPMHPNCSLGFVPHHDLMDFIARASFGAFIQLSPEYEFDIESGVFNPFHRSFLVWTFHYQHMKYPIQLKSHDYDQRIWTIKNPYFYSFKIDNENIFDKKDQNWIRRKIFSDKFHASFAQVLCYRLREGFTIKAITINGNYIEIELSLPWRSNVIIEYLIRGDLHNHDTSCIGDNHEDEQRMLNFEVWVESNYTFLHDVTCAINVPKSLYRANNVKQFWSIIKSFTETDKLGMHFHKFAQNDMFRSIPRAISNGLPLFVMSIQSNTPDVSHNQEDFLKFAQLWRPICMLDMNMCQKSSLHTVQINLLLQHDQPLPEHLYYPNNSGRYDNIQSNQALSALNVTLKEWSTFVLLENHSYVKLIEDEKKTDKKDDSCSFYLLRIISQPPCIVLHLAFFGGTTNSLRNQIVCELSQKLSKCKLPHRNLSSSLMQTNSNSVKEEFENKSDADILEDDSILHFTADNKSQSENSEDNADYANSEKESFSESTVVSLDEENRNQNKSSTPGVAGITLPNLCCFILLNRSLERMLICYERIPNDFYSCFSYEEDLKSTSIQQKSYLSIFQTLTRSLFHKRFIWNTHQAPQTKKLPNSAIAKVLSTLTARRLQEGFHLAHNDSGIVNLVLELTLRDELECEFSCLVQYVIFPANVAVRNIEQHSVNPTEELEEEPNAELDDCLIVTECWIEPQNGRVFVQSTSPSPQTTVPLSHPLSSATQSGGAAQSLSQTISSNMEINQNFLSGLNYEEIANAFFETDFKLINSLLTYEHLVSFTTCESICIASGADELYKPIPAVNRDSQVNNTKIDFHNYAEDDEEEKHKLSTKKSKISIKFKKKISNLNSRFNSIKYDFNLLSLIERSQQALIKFPTLKQCFDNEYFTDKDFANTILYSEFLIKILALNEKELEMSHCDTIQFIRFINKRLQELNYDTLFQNVDRLEQDFSIAFKCFCKQISESCIVLTILPQSFCTLKKLSVTLLEQIKNKSDESLMIPIFVYKLTFSGLSRVLMKNKEEFDLIFHSPEYNLFFDYTQNLKNFVFDFKSKYDSNSMNKFSFSSTSGTSNQNEVILEHYVKSIEIFYWNAFTDAIYKALRYRIDCHPDDVKFILEKICRKSCHVIDLTEFLIYTCRHLKPILNQYFEKYRNHSIVNLVENITHGKGQEYSEIGFCSLKELFEILTNSKDKEDCCNSVNNELKINFKSRILDHFQLIDIVSSNNNDKYFYFFNYENIQRCKYMLEDDNHQNLDKIRVQMFDFYRKLDSGIKKLYEVSQIRDLQSESNSCKISSSSEALFDQTTDQLNDKHKDIDKYILNKKSKFNDEYDPDADEDNHAEIGSSDEEGQMFVSMFLSKPFFVNFQYSFFFRGSDKRDGECLSSIQTIPTCLMELFHTIPEMKSIDNKLDSFRVCLKIELITQNFENSVITFPMEKKSSVISMHNNDSHVHSISHQNRPHFLQYENSVSSIWQSQLGPVLDNFQLLNYRDFISKIEWLIRDEIVSMSHNSFPICPNTLQMIVNHIRAVGSVNTEKILVEKVDLKFIVDKDESCLEQFKNMLVELKFSNFQISRLEQFFYVILQSSYQISLNFDQNVIDHNNDDINDDNNNINNNINNANHSNDFDNNNNNHNHINDGDGDDNYDDDDHTALIYTADSIEHQCDQCFIINEEYFDDLPLKDRIFYSIEETKNPASIIPHFSPNFWLIMTIEQEKNCSSQGANNHVWLYFHSRQNIFLCGLQIFNRLKKSLDLLCKKINQKMLLDQLNETRKCSELLISVEDKDPFAKTYVRNALNSTPISHIRLESELINNEPFDFDIGEDDKNFAYFKSNFIPGSFGCDIVWHKHFALHSRLHGKDQRINIVKAFLTSFNIGNRNNLYVFKEKSSAVFYFRIYEIECDHKHVIEEKLNSFGELNESLDLRKHQTNDSKPINYYDNIVTTSVHYENIIQDDDQNVADVGRDNDSIASFSNVPLRDPNLPVQLCILLNVHGISEPTKEIQEDMVNAIQKRLEEATLKELILAFSINQAKTFTNDDINFIQSKNSTSENFYFVINEDYTPYLTNLKAYIRQNMSTFMYNPKYNDPTPEAHFKLYKNEEFHCVLDDDVFIFNSTDKLSPGIACVILSIVSRDKMLLPPVFGFSLTATDLNDFRFCNFDNITGCYPQAQENVRVQFYINFQVWACGKVLMDYLKERLSEVIRNALWDFNMEFKVFKLCNNETELEFEVPVSSNTEIVGTRSRKSGVALFDSISFKRYLTSGFSSSFQQTSISSNGDFKFERSQTFDPVIENEKFEKSERLRNSIENILLPWLNFSQSLKVASVKIFTFNLVMRNCLDSIFKEFVKLQTLGMKIHYLSEGIHGPEILQNTEFERKFTILFRREDMWNATRLNSHDESDSFAFVNCVKTMLKTEYSSLKFSPVFSNGNKVFNESVSNLNVIELKPNSGEETLPLCTAARQKFLLFQIEGRRITMYFYNWSDDFLDTFKALFSNLVVWHNCRSLLQRSLIMQKAGIFHDLPFQRYSFDEILQLSDVLENDLNLHKMIPNIDCEKFFKNIELLLKHVSPVNAAKELKEPKDRDIKSTTALAELIFESKNYSYIFSTLNDERRRQCKDLFQFFEAQFNSNWNNYIRDLRDLSKVWEVPGTKLNSPIMDRIVGLIKKYGRMSHFCLTPFLFSEKWRHAVSLIRDHTLLITSRNRHMSGVGLGAGKCTSEEFQIGKRSRRKSGPPNMFDSIMGGIGRGNDDGRNFVSVRRNFMQEYVQYLQSALGFNSIKSQKFARTGRIGNLGQKFSITARDEFGPHYCIKSVYGGLLVFEIGFCEPYVYSYLYVFDSGQLTTWNKADFSCMSVNTFLDELDSIKIRMHLHSFTYDYHLRAIHSYISGVKFLFAQGYHLISFLDDFIKYYQKAPNYARNYVVSDIIKFESKRLSPEHLYDYLIAHNKMYGLEVFDMRPNTIVDKFFESKNEYVLIQLASYQVPSSADETKSFQDENFSVGILVTYQKQRPEPMFITKDTNSTMMILKFFVVVTSQRITFPKLISLTDHAGAFRTIRLLSSNFSNSRKSSILYSGESSMENSFNSKLTSTNIDRHRNLMEGLSLDAGQSFPGITDERINYMGYFNVHEINMLNLLNEKANEIKKQLRTIISAAEVDCRRDYLWNCFLPFQATFGAASNETLSMELLDELLSLVSAVRFDEYDLNLSQFYQFSQQWYKTLAQKIEIRFDNFCRKFSNEQQFKLILFRQDCKECFVLFEWHSPSQTVNFRLVFKRPPKMALDGVFLSSCSKVCHELVEDFINIATAHMWSMLM